MAEAMAAAALAPVAGLGSSSRSLRASCSEVQLTSFKSSRSTELRAVVRRASVSTALQFEDATSFFGASSSFCPPVPLGHNRANQAGMTQAAWTRRTKGPLEPPKGKKSWKQRHEKFLKPFILDVFLSHKYVHAKVVHRLTSKVISVATTNAKDLRYSLYSLTDENACKTIGKLLAERTIEADVFAVTFNLRKNERFEGRLALVINTMVDNGVALI